MGILLTNGDSFTYGDELRGSRSPDGIDTHHHHTFTYKLASMIDRKYANLGKNGSSNCKIYRRTIDHLMTDPREVDLVVITWSSMGRYEICEMDQKAGDASFHIDYENNMNQIIPSQKTLSLLYNFGPHPDENQFRHNTIKEYVENVLTVQTQIFKTLTYMKHIQWICDTKGIPVIQGIVHPANYHSIMHTLKLDGWSDYKSFVIDTLSYLRPECKIGFGYYSTIYEQVIDEKEILPMGHVNEDCHTRYADVLLDVIKEKGLLDVIN